MSNGPLRGSNCGFQIAIIRNKLHFSHIVVFGAMLGRPQVVVSGAKKSKNFKNRNFPEILSFLERRCHRPHTLSRPHTLVTLPCIDHAPHAFVAPNMHWPHPTHWSRPTAFATPPCIAHSSIHLSWSRGYTSRPTYSSHSRCGQCTSVTNEQGCE